jgi:site-specific recombinase XerD
MFLFKRSNGFYYLYFIDDAGRRKCISTKAKYKPDALRFLTDFKNKPKPVKETPVIYLSGLRGEVMKYVSDNMSKTTAGIYKTVFDNLERVFKNKPVKMINNSDIENYKSIRAGEVSRASVNKELRTIKAVFNIAIRFEWVSDNPLKYVKKLTIPEKEYLAFTRDETGLILNNIENACINKLCYFALLTGCRIDEIINLQWRDVNLSESAVTIRNKPNFKTKTGRIREIPVSDELNTLLKSMLETEGNVIKHFTPDMYIFANGNGYKYTKNYVSKYFKRVLRNLNFPEKYHFHCLRHTYITALIKGGVNINYVKEIAGHSSIKTTENYIHISNNDLREAVKHINIL